MASEVTICNRALSHIGHAPINALSDITIAAQECTRLYAEARDAVLEDFPWNFATKEATLGLSATETVSGWGYVYTAPSDCINGLRIWNQLGSPNTGTSYDIDTESWKKLPMIPFEFRSNAAGDGRLIVTDQVDAVLIYTARITVPNMFSPMFIVALGWQLASELVYPLKRDRASQKELRDVYKGIIMEAMTSNANEGFNSPENERSLIDSRGF